MQQTRKFKLCLVGDALSGGGAERVQAFLSQYFHQHGIEVHHVIVQDLVSYDFSGELLNMGKLKNSRNDVFDKLKRFWVLRKYIRRHYFDYIIDFRMRQKPLQDLLISRLVYTVPVVYSVRSSNIDWYMPKQSWLTRLIYAKAYGIVSITYKMEQYIRQRHGLKNLKTIYSPLNLDYIDQRIGEGNELAGYDYILAAGRMSSDNVKQFDKLIEAYAASVLPARDIRLVILGKGPLKESLVQMAEDKGLADKVVFNDFQENPYSFMHRALYFVLSSRFEGLPMVLLESLACGTPAVAFDCFTGPSEIIQHGHNGLLVPDQDFSQLTEAMNRMTEDKVLYEKCRQNARASVSKFDMKTIGVQWLNYLKVNNQ